jgi:hypothetical protein
VPRPLKAFPIQNPSMPGIFSISSYIPNLVFVY